MQTDRWDFSPRTDAHENAVYFVNYSSTVLVGVMHFEWRIAWPWPAHFARPLAALASTDDL